MSTVPANPVDVEHAALDLLVNVPELAAETDHFRTALQDFAGLLQLESAFVGLGWADARRAAVMVCRLALFEDDPVAALRVAAVLAGCEEPAWHDRAAAARAFSVAATVLETV
ncbi:amino acid aminotransferase [Mycobacterium sp. 5-140-3-2]|uniref:amino acid aminotransferase n=1 Tax=Mycobacterium TaxID=1763 RepID=UPI001915A796|nr:MULTISPECIES: amino acid aminotransferase [Mycobacterium]WRU80659.1 amino acid aminotransferase [Mycobacterium sp. 5-140-3-2]WSE43188.1 amino acid aminotransferase [Mycobacterium sp. 5-140-3-1]BCP05891.1 hypothetical protein MINTM019_33470 [Mycobacterium paraintracellulare]BCP11019.1 hypothetical protein MINTM020_31170 [Mycobacterium paraintracellulare]